MCWYSDKKLQNSPQNKFLYMKRENTFRFENNGLRLNTSDILSFFLGVQVGVSVCFVLFIGPWLKGIFHDLLYCMILLEPLKVFWGESFPSLWIRGGAGGMIKCRWDVKVRLYVGGCLSGWDFSWKLWRSQWKKSCDEYAPTSIMLAVKTHSARSRREVFYSHWNM